MKQLSKLIICLALLAPFAASAQQWVEGTHYRVVERAQDRPADGKVEVMYVFWYGCPSCYNLETPLNRWLQDLPEYVDFKRIAASMAPSWRVHARAYYTAQSLDVVETMHPRMFRAIHLERNALGSPDAIAALFREHAGVDEETFRQAYNSFGVETRMRRGDQQTRRYRLGGVPAMVVNGRFVTDPGMAEGHEQMVRLVDYLARKEWEASANGD